MSAEQQAAIDRMGIRDDATFATRATDAASRVSDATFNTTGADTFRTTTSAEQQRSFREQCIAKAKGRASEIAESLNSKKKPATDGASPNDLQGKPASKGPATTAPSKTTDANEHKATMGSGAGG